MEKVCSLSFSNKKQAIDYGFENRGSRVLKAFRGFQSRFISQFLYSSPNIIPNIIRAHCKFEITLTPLSLISGLTNVYDFDVEESYDDDHHQLGEIVTGVPHGEENGH